MRNRSLALCFFYAACALTLLSCRAEPSAQSAPEEVTDSASVQQSIAELSDQIVRTPNNAQLYIQRSDLYMKAGMGNLALRDAERALAIDSTSSYLQQKLGEVAYANSDMGLAARAFERALVLDSTNTDAWLKVAEVDFIMRRYQEAMDRINMALRINQELPDAYYLKGFVYSELGDTALARSSFQTATELDPEHYNAYIQLGVLSTYQNDPLALAYFNTALRIRPGSAEALYNKGMYLQGQDSLAQAIEVYRQLIAAHPDEFLGYYNTGYIYLTKYLSFDTAIAYFDSALAVQPAMIDALYNKGLAYEEKGLPVKAEEIYTEVLKVNPQHTLAARGLSRLVE